MPPKKKRCKETMESKEKDVHERNFDNTNTNKERISPQSQGKEKNNTQDKVMIEKKNNKNKNNDENSYKYQFYLEEKLQDLSSSLKKDFQKTVDDKIEEWKIHLVPRDQNGSFTLESQFSVTNQTTETKENKGSIPSHVFRPRESLLNEMLKIDHIRGIYNILIATLIILGMGEFLEGILHDGSFNVDISLIIYSFGKPLSMLTIWAGMKFSTVFLVYSSFYAWAYNRHINEAFADFLAALIFALYACLFFYLPVEALIRYQLPPTSSFIILCEQTRLVMKTWAFVRSNIPRAKSNKKIQETKCPSFSCYLYYLFAPTLIYRDQYPRTKSCNWGKVVQDLGHVVGCILFANLLFTRFCLPIVQTFGKEEFSMSKLMISIFSCCFPGSLLYILGFFMFLHSWMNAFAEMLTFADRMFYKDWWNSSSYPRFYRTWNCVVHDWLYEYVYKDVAELYVTYGFSFASGRKVSKLLVFFISALVHEYILAFSLRFYYPVLLVLFGGFGVVLMFIKMKSEKFNIFLWFSLILGMGILVCLYFLEWYARINCPPLLDGFIDFLVPRSWFCRS